MSAFQFRPAVRENVGLIIGLAGGTGSGKTYTALRLASGIAGDAPFAVIDTEAGRAKHYADEFRFDHGDLTAPFRPDHYVDAIEAADKAGYPVIVVDSMSHVWAGDGGVLDWQEEEYKRLGNNDSIKLLSWAAPKRSHKQMVSRLLQVRAHLILCFRAEPHVEMVKEGGRTKVVPKTGPTGYGGWFPVCEKNLPFELTVSFMLMSEKPGVPMPIKTLSAKHRPLFELDKPITEESGRRIAEWARGGSLNNGAAPSPVPTVSPGSGPTMESGPTFISVDQVTELGDMLSGHGLDREKFCTSIKVPSLQMIPADKYAKAKAIIAETIEKRRATA